MHQHRNIYISLIAYSRLLYSLKSRRELVKAFGHAIFLDTHYLRVTDFNLLSYHLFVPSNINNKLT